MARRTVTRLSFHHFAEMEPPFREMSRVLKNRGKLVIIDMEATREQLRETEDRIETMRDVSHVRNRSKKEFLDLYETYGYDVVKVETTPISVRLNAWMQLTQTPDAVQKEILSLMQQERQGGLQTGFFPYEKEREICFDQRWLRMIGIKDRAKALEACGAPANG